MNIQICSDLHLEFSANRKWLKEHPLQPKAEILIIAGDTYYLNRSFHKLDFIKKVSDEFKEVYLIPGNHEYYEGYDASTGLSPFEMEIKDNVTLLNNKSMDIEGIKFIFSTFWSLIQERKEAVFQGMVDFRRIKWQEAPFTVDQFNQLHQNALDFVSREVATDQRTIVISHHLPSMLCNSEEFKGSPLTEAFCVDKTDFILNSEIDCWIYGHSHRNLADFKIGKTQMVTNQFGYVGWNEHHSFIYDRVITL